jgi:hypothetical protein
MTFAEIDIHRNLLVSVFNEYEEIIKKLGQNPETT